MQKIKSILAFVALMLCGGAWAAEASVGPNSIDWSFVGVLVSVVSVIISVIAAIVSVCQAKKASKDAKELRMKVTSLELKEKYFTDDMYAAVKRLWEVKAEWTKQPKYAITSRAELSDDIQQISATNLDGSVASYGDEDANSRRKIKAYFLEILNAFDKGLIADADLHALCRVNAFVLFFDVVEPMEALLNQNYNSCPFMRLMVLCKVDYLNMRNQTF